MQASTTAAEFDRRCIVGLLWVYFALLIGEGALRKWVLPGWSDALLVIRDPVALAILLLALRSQLFVFSAPARAFVAVTVAFVVLALLQIAVGVFVSVPVLLYGLRTYCLHPPLIFVMGRVLGGRDLRRMALVVMLLMLPISLLMVEQFRAAPTDWINAGAGAGRAQIRSALGHIRPPGPFSFISGPVLFYAVGLACLIGSEFGKGADLFFARCAGWVALVIAAAVSGSRSLIVGLAPVIVSVVVALVMRPSAGGRLLRGAVIATFIISVVWSSAAVRDGIVVLNTRVAEAAATEDVGDRVQGTYLGSWSTVIDAPLFGNGLGLGTNAAGAMLSSGAFRLGEDEWTRVILEAGPLFGLVYLGWRFWLVAWLTQGALRAASLGYLLPILWIAASSTNLVNGNWGQPTTQGFAVWSAGMAIAASRIARLSPGSPIPLRAGLRSFNVTRTRSTAEAI